VIEKPNLPDGFLGALEESSASFPMAKHFVEEIVFITEIEIRKAISYAWYYLGQRVDGSGVIHLAAIMSGRVTGKYPCRVIIGDNILDEVFPDIMNEYPKELNVI
jgi:threonine dehydratase